MGVFDNFYAYVRTLIDLAIKLDEKAQTDTTREISNKIKEIIHEEILKD